MPCTRLVLKKPLPLVKILVNIAALLYFVFPPAHAEESLLHTQDHMIVNAAGKNVLLTGFNLGGWFVMEPFMSPMDRAHKLTDTYSVMSTLERRFGRTESRQMMRTYQQNWITADDIGTIAAAGYNVVRIPLWWGQFFDLDKPTPSGWRSDAFDVLDQIVRACQAHNVYVILDMHGVIGSQSPASNTGQAKQNTYWTSAEAKKNTDFMWSKIAKHYAQDSTIAGYDLINEPAPPKEMPAKETVWGAYDRLYHAVRNADPHHIIFMEGAFGKWDWDMLPDPTLHSWKNVVYEMHEYRWPKAGESAERLAHAQIDNAQRSAADFQAHSNWHVPGYIGEFNAFDTGADTWRSVINSYDQAGLSWSMWAYKAVNGTAPNHWGYQDPRRWPARPDPATDDAATIPADWTNWTTEAAFVTNTAVGLRAP